MRLAVPVLPSVPLPVPLCHHNGRHHGDHDGDGDDQHGGRLRHAQVTVQPGQRRSGQLRRILTRHVPVVVDVEVTDVEDLTEDTVQIAVAGPGVS